MARTLALGTACDCPRWSVKAPAYLCVNRRSECPAKMGPLSEMLYRGSKGLRRMRKFNVNHGDYALSTYLSSSI